MTIEFDTKRVAALAVAAGEKIMDRWGKALVVGHKDSEQLDVVTDTDRAVEALLIEELKKVLPDAGFEVEEHTEQNKNGEYRWVIDPIDGSKYFASGIPLFSVSIALVKGIDPIFGVIYNPVSRQLYHGGPTFPATLNDQLIRVAAIDTVSRSTISVDWARKKESLDLLSRLAGAAYRVRIIGSGALSLAWVAAGSTFNAYVSISDTTKFVDIAAGLAICQGAGAVVQHYSHPAFNFPFIIVGSAPVAAQLEELCKN